MERVSLVSMGRGTRAACVHALQNSLGAVSGAAERAMATGGSPAIGHSHRTKSADVCGFVFSFVSPAWSGAPPAYESSSRVAAS